MVFGATTFRQFVRMLAESTEDSEVRDPWVTRMRSMPTTVVSSTLEGSLDWPDATVTGDTGTDPVFGGAADFDLTLLENRTLDGDILELVYRPTVH